MSLKHVVTSQRGLTLIELLVAVFISTFVFTAVFSLFKEGLVSYDRTVSEADIQSEVKYVHDVMKRDVINSKVGSFEGIAYPFNENSQKLILFNGSMKEPAYITYFIEENQLYRLDSEVARKLLMENISDFSIDITDQDLVKVTISKRFMTSYSNEVIKKDIFIQAKPRSQLR